MWEWRVEKEILTRDTCFIVQLQIFSLHIFRLTVLILAKHFDAVSMRILDATWCVSCKGKTRTAFFLISKQFVHIVRPFNQLKCKTAFEKFMSSVEEEISERDKKVKIKTRFKRFAILIPAQKCNKLRFAREKTSASKKLRAKERKQWNKSASPKSVAGRKKSKQNRDCSIVLVRFAKSLMNPET